MINLPIQLWYTLAIVIYIEEENLPKKLWKTGKNDEADIKNMEKLIDLLEENDDVQNVYHNWEQDWLRPKSAENSLLSGGTATFFNVYL